MENKITPRHKTVGNRGEVRFWPKAAIRLQRGSDQGCWQPDWQFANSASAAEVLASLRPLTTI